MLSDFARVLNHTLARPAISVAECGSGGGTSGMSCRTRESHRSTGEPIRRRGGWIAGSRHLFSLKGQRQVGKDLRP